MDVNLISQLPPNYGINNVWYLEKKFCICYNASRQKVMSLTVWSTKTPEVASSGVFYSVLAGWLMP